MTFRLQPIEFPLEAKGDWIERQLTSLDGDAQASEDLLLGHIGYARRSYCICGVRGMGKTSLLNKIAFDVNSRARNIIAVGPLSMTRFSCGGGSYRLESELHRVLSELTGKFPNRFMLPDFASLPRTFEQFAALLEKLPHNTTPKARFLIVLDDLDAVSAKDRKLIFGDLKKLLASAPQVKVLCAGNFLDDEFPSAVTPLKENLMGFKLGAFGKDELEAYFAKLTRHFGIVLDQMTRVSRALRTAFKAYSQSVPYFLQAMTLNIYEQGHPSGMNIGPRTLEDMTRKMSPALMSPILEPLNQLKGKSRAKAQEILTKLLESEGEVAASDVDWADPVVRNLWRGGIIWRNKENHKLVWAAPLLAEWFKKAESEIVSEGAPKRESEQTEKGAQKEKKAKPSEVNKTRTVKGESAQRPETGAPRMRPPSGGAIKKGPPSGGSIKKGASPTERYVNLWFTRERGVDQSRIPKQLMLRLNQPVFLQVNIGPFDVHNILKDAQTFVSEAEMRRAFPETVGQPVQLDVVLFSRREEFFVAPEDRTQKLDLLPGQPTRPLYFPVKPLRMPFSHLRVCVFYRNHLLQSLDVTVMATPNPIPNPRAQSASVGVTFSAGFSRVETLPARALWLGINHAADGTHTLNMKDTGTALTRNLAGKLEKALTDARKALLKVSFIENKDEEGNVVKDYRFNADNFPKLAASKEQQEKRLKEDLTTLAEAGMSLYAAVFGQVPTAEEKETVLPIVRAMKETLRYEQVIQIARLKSMEDIWPWAMIYDSYVDPGNVKSVCTAFRGDGKRALPYAEGVQKCQHRDPATGQGQDETVVCPYSFWGFKHIIEQPVQPGGKQAFSDLVLEIKDFVLLMGLENTLGQKEADHIKQMQDLRFKPLGSLEEINTALKLGPNVLYFFCHGKYDVQHEPYLQVGTNQSLRPTQLAFLDLSWASSHGLVFINGCHTVEMEPKDLAPIMSPFVNAGASGIIGTEITVTTALAREFAQEFFKRFLSQGFPTQRVGQIIKDVRLNLLMKFNPLGLVYTPYCSADLHVVR